MATSNPTFDKIVRIPFLDPADLRPGQETLLSKDQIYLNGYFEPVMSPGFNKPNFHFIKRPGFSSYLTPTAGTGRGLYNWKQTNKLYSVNNSKIYSNTTDLGVTLSTSAGVVNFEETRPGASTQYLGVNDGSALYLIAIDDSVIVMNNVAITSSSVANPTTITANNHGLNTGNKIIIRNHTGSTPSINDTIFTITKTGVNTFTIPVNVTVGGTGGTIGVFPAPNTNDLHYMDGYWFTMKPDGSVWNCAVDDPTTWPTINFIYAQMLPGRGAGMSKQNNTLVAFTDRHMQLFADVSNPVGSPLGNIEQAMQRVGCASTDSIAYQENTTFWVSSTLTGGFTVYRLDGTAGLEDIGTPTLERSLVSNFFQTPGAAVPTQVVLTGSGNWTVPGDFNKNNNTVEAIGGGGGGSKTDFDTGVGGGGGAYTKIVNFDPGIAATIPYVTGSGGTGGFGSGPPFAATDGGDTSFNTTSLIAKGGINGSGAATGGQASACTPTTYANSGGNGGPATGAVGGGAGGGGAGGRLGSGGNGHVNTVDGSGFPTVGGQGGQGDPTIGGLGGVDGSNGGTGTEWSSLGSGGGGGGGHILAAGGNGGLYGGGGGGGGSSGNGGNGANGVIVITYTPSSAAANSAANGYILRISGHMFYVLNLATSNETWVYDVKAKIWTKWSSGVTYWPIINTVQYTPTGASSLIVGQLASNGALMQISQSIGQDNGTNFTVEIQTPPLTFGSLARKYWNRVELIGDKQLTSTPVLISYTDNDYGTYSNPRTFDMVNTRNFGRSWGTGRRRAFKMTYTGANPLRISELEISYSEGMFL